jgi:micrococcal nuclease
MYEYSCEVKRVVDGDTIDVIMDLGFDIFHKCRVRLYGIDTPESRTRDLEEKARGLLAKKYLKEHIKKADKIIIQTKLKDSKGKFGRVLGSVVADGVNLNNLMTLNHHAVIYHGQSKTEIEEEHLKNREKLINSGRYKIDPKFVPKIL